MQRSGRKRPTGIGRWIEAKSGFSRSRVDYNVRVQVGVSGHTLTAGQLGRSRLSAFMAPGFTRSQTNLRMWIAVKKPVDKHPSTSLSQIEGSVSRDQSRTA
jgi:hypothetical protein